MLFSLLGVLSHQLGNYTEAVELLNMRSSS